MRLPGKGMSWKSFLIELKNEVVKDNISDVAGAVAFSGILALFPFLLFAVSLASVVIEPAQIEQLIHQLARVAPAQVTQIVGQQIHSLTSGKSTGLLTFGALGAIWAASGGVLAISRALNTTYGVEEKRGFFKLRGIAVLTTFLIAGMALLATLSAVVTPMIADKLGEPLGTVVTWLRLPFAAAIMLVLWAFIYYLLPDVEQKFVFITPGSLVGVTVWLLASWGFSLYAKNFGSYDATYGALGGVVVLLVWMWISAQVLLLGAEINALIDHRSPDSSGGKRAKAKKLEDSGENLPGRPSNRNERGASPAYGGPHA